MNPNASEAPTGQFAHARRQGEGYGNALGHMTDQVVGDQVGSAIEDAEGMDAWHDGGPAGRDPGEANLHVEVEVRDAGDSRRFERAVRVEFRPGLVQRGRG